MIYLQVRNFLGKPEKSGNIRKFNFGSGITRNKGMKSEELPTT